MSILTAPRVCRSRRDRLCLAAPSVLSPSPPSRLVRQTAGKLRTKVQELFARPVVELAAGRWTWCVRLELPDARQVRLAVSRTRGRCGKVRLAVRQTRHASRRMVHPLSFDPRDRHEGRRHAADDDGPAHGPDHSCWISLQAGRHLAPAPRCTQRQLARRNRSSHVVRCLFSAPSSTTAKSLRFMTMR